MSEHAELIVGHVFSIGMLFSFIFLMYGTGKTEGYRKGQIDAQNGIRRWRKIKNEDGEVVWTDTKHLEEKYKVYED